MSDFKTLFPHLNASHPTTKASGFGQFLEDLASSTPDEKAIIKSMRDKLAKERAARVEEDLRAVYANIDRHVRRIRAYKKDIELCKKMIGENKELAKKILQGGND